MYVIAALMIIQLFGCASGLEEIVAETYSDGSPKVVKYYAGEGRNKTMVKEATYYPDGQVRLEGEYKNGKKDGHWVSYYENGHKWSEGYYTNGINNGETTTWHENGEVYYTGFYDHGHRSGTWKFYDEKGDFIKEINYDALNDPKIESLK